MKKIILLLVLCIFINEVSAQVTFTNESISIVGSERAVVDMNGDNLDDIVSVSSSNVNVHYQLEGGGFNTVNIPTTAADNTASWSMAAADYDGNGFTDLLYGGGSGVTFMRANNSGTGFTEISGSEYVFSQRSNFVDINNDGHLDAFVCHDVAPNVYYINDGSGNLTYNQGGLGDYSSGGNYGSVWIDYDNDGDLDMFIAKCGGEEARRTNQMHTNNGDGTFTENALDLGLADPMQTWSSAWGDFDNDGDMDVYVGASSGSSKFMRNNGDNTFTDITVSANVGSIETGIESCTYDFDNDGYLDIASNGDISFGNGDLTFGNPVGNEIQSGSFGDLNNDGFVDSFDNGTINWNDGNANNWLTITTRGLGPDLGGSNLNGIGARLELVTSSGVQIRDVRIGEGFRNSSTLNTHFGIGADTEITSLTINWPSGIVDVYNDVTINQVIKFVEGETILGLNDNEVNDLIVYPNPTTERLNLSVASGFDNAVYMIYDVNGRKVLGSKLVGSSIDVSNLSTGNYVLRFISDGNIKIQKFVKN
jgi:hypothetical protein